MNKIERYIIILYKVGLYLILILTTVFNFTTVYVKESLKLSFNNTKFTVREDKFNIYVFILKI